MLPLAQVDSGLTIANEMLKNGVLGVCVVALAIVIVVLWRDKNASAAQLASLHERRVADSQATTTQLVDINTATISALTNSTNALEAQTTRDSELKSSLDRLTDELRRGPQRR